MDGTDGLAASMGAIGFAAYGLATGDPAADPSGFAAAPALFALAAAIVPFLVVNRPRASMFLGDVGAVPLGFLAAVFGIAGVAGRWWPAWFPLLVFLPFIADATLTLARRARRRRAALGRAPQPLLPAAASAGRRATAVRSRSMRRRWWAPRRRRSPAACGRLPQVGGHSLRGLLSSSCCSPRLIIIGARRPTFRPRPPMTFRLNWRASLAFFHDACMAAIAWVGIYWLRFNLDLREPFATDMLFTLAWILPLQAAIFLALGLYRGLWRFASLLDLQRIVARRGARRDPHSAGARDAEAAGRRAAQRAVLLSDRADLPDGRLALRVPHLEGAPALQPAGRTGRAGARRRRGRGGRAPDQRDGAQPPVARRRAARRRRDEARPAAAQRQRAGSDRGARPVGAPLRRAQGDHRAAVGESRRAPARRGALRGGARRGAHRPGVRGPDVGPHAADDAAQRRARRPARPRSGRPRQRGHRRMARQSNRHGDGRGRIDRRRALPADRALSPGAPRAVRALGGCAVRDQDGARRRVSAARRRVHRRRRQARVDRRGRARAREARRHLPCGRLQARAADGGDERVAGGAQQRVRHVGARARGRRRRRSRSSCSSRPTRR